MNAPYTQADGKWHSEYMAMVKTMSTDSLRYVIEGCRNAIEALPENPIYPCGWQRQQYMDEIHYCATELRFRNEAAAPHDNAVKAQMALHAEICENPTHPNISAAQDQFDIAERAYDLAEYHKATEACYRGLLMMGGK
jgi:hypothetical protein